jgi:hypothetical protein
MLKGDGVEATLRIGLNILREDNSQISDRSLGPVSISIIPAKSASRTTPSVSDFGFDSAAQVSCLTWLQSTRCIAACESCITYFLQRKKGVARTEEFITRGDEDTLVEISGRGTTEATGITSDACCPGSRMSVFLDHERPGLVETLPMLWFVNGCRHQGCQRIALVSKDLSRLVGTGESRAKELENRQFNKLMKLTSCPGEVVFKLPRF